MNLSSRVFTKGIQYQFTTSNSITSLNFGAFCAILRCCVLDVWHTPSHLRLVLHKNHSKLNLLLLLCNIVVASHSKYIHTSSCLRLALHKNHLKLKMNVAFCVILRCCALDILHTPSHLRLVLHKNHSKLKINVAFCAIYCVVVFNIKLTSTV